MDLSDEFINDRLVPTRKFDSLVPYNIQDANSASMKIREYTLENEVAAPSLCFPLSTSEGSQSRLRANAAAHDVGYEHWPDFIRQTRSIGTIKEAEAEEVI